MKIAIFETSHFEVTNTLISLFDKPGNEITVFVHPEAYRQLLFLLNKKGNKYNWCVKKETESNRGFIKRMFHYTDLQAFDLLYFNTISDNFIFYVFYLRKLKSIPSILTLHDINGHFQYNASFSLVRLARYIGKRLLIKRFRYFNVLADSMIAYLQDKLPPGKKVFSIPGSHFVPDSVKLVTFESGDKIKIVIPGSVDERRRDYLIVKQLLETASRQNIAIEICLLGAFTPSHSENTKEFCHKYLQHNANLKIFTEQIVDQPEFAKYMQESHFVLIPLRQSISINDGITEEYGKSICSGNIGDVIKYAKPFFIQKRIPVDEALQGSAIRYDNFLDILAVIQQLTSHDYSERQKKSFSSSLHYTKEQIIKRNSQIFCNQKKSISTP